MDLSKRVFLTQSEIDNAEISYSGNEYTIIRRPQPDGKYWVAAIRLMDQRVLCEQYAVNKSAVRDSVRYVNRWVDKLANGGKMSSKSRSRKNLTSPTE